MSIIKFKVSILLSFILIICLASVTFAASSSNIPLGSYIYEDLERLELKGLINTAILSSKPFSRIEGARLVQEAVDASESFEFEDVVGYQAILERLKKEFAPELSGNKEKVRVTSLESAFLTYLYSSKDPVHMSKNNDGDVYSSASNVKGAFTSKVTFYDTVTVLIEPQAQFNSSISELNILNGYAILDFLGLEFEVGRDSLWWGSGSNGALLMSNNARPFDMVKFTTTEAVDFLGQFKPVIFYTSLGTDNQAVHNTKLCGIRLDLKPLTWFQFGLTRTMMFGGDGRTVMGLAQWWNAFWVQNNQEHFSNTFNNKQLASIDATFTYINQTGFLPFTAIRIYNEWAASDSNISGGSIVQPNGWSVLAGALIDEPANISGTDLRFEFGDTALNQRYGFLWYTDQLYSTGYTYMSRVIGDAMGGDSKNIYLRGQYHLDNGAVYGLEFEQVWNGIYSTPSPGILNPYNHSLDSITDIWIGGDVSYPINEYLTIQGGAGYENLKNSTKSITNRGIVVWSTLRVMHI
ncbi:MAG: hypothetical protein HQK91_11530 [Nitrospirae bacterium]|nr:hypothetical protein [Nitrospirota bacterium]